MTHTNQSKRIVNYAALVEPSVMRLERQPALASVDGWAINLPDQRTAIDAITKAAKAGASFTVFTLNLDHLVKLRSSEVFQRAYRNATFVTADGEPVARLARREAPSVMRTTGADLLLPLAEECAESGLPVFLFGTSPGVLAKAAERLVHNTNGGLEITGTLSPPLGFDPEGPEADAAIERIARSGARLCFVALGAPKQEIFAARAQEQGVKAGFVCIGASLDFLAGEQIRAPRAFQRAGFEWLWRLGSNPRRLAARYAQCALLLAELKLLAPPGGSSPGRRIP